MAADQPASARARGRCCTPTPIPPALAIHSPAGHNGFPGAVTATCRYTLAQPATLRIELWAVSDAPTIINLCHHSYFNLDGSPHILDHTLELRADHFTPTDADLIPDGRVESVAGTPLDFRQARPVGMAGANGTRVPYDHNFLLRRDRCAPSAATGLDVAHAATLASEKSGIAMELWTTEPACQLYDGAKINVQVAGLDGATLSGKCGTLSRAAARAQLAQPFPLPIDRASPRQRLPASIGIQIHRAQVAGRRRKFPKAAFPSPIGLLPSHRRWTILARSDVSIRAQH